MVSKQPCASCGTLAKILPHAGGHRWSIHWFEGKPCRLSGKPALRPRRGNGGGALPGRFHRARVAARRAR